MKCPYCSTPDTKVVDSRPSPDGREIKRRRECVACGKRFTTYEKPELFLPVIIKKDGSRQPYERRKLISGLHKAVGKRPVSMAQIEQIADEVESRLEETGEREAPSTLIGETIMERLSVIDHVAYVRFASVYREFKELDDFTRTAKALAREARSQAKATAATTAKSPRDTIAGPTDAP